MGLLILYWQVKYLKKLIISLIITVLPTYLLPTYSSLSKLSTPRIFVRFISIHSMTLEIVL